jgi:hypothetical protein
MGDGYLVESCRALVAAVLLQAVRDLERRGVYQASAVRFLTGEYGAGLAEQVDVDPAASRSLAAGIPAGSGCEEKILALAREGLGVDTISIRVLGGSWPGLRDQVELVLAEAEVYGE